MATIALHHAAGTAMGRAAGAPVGAVLHRASALAGDGGAARADRMLPVASELRAVLPGLRRGSTVAVRPEAGSLVLALLAGVSEAGGWSAVVGLPRLSPLAAVQAGVALDRLVLVPDPGLNWPTVVAALLDGVDLVVIAPPARPAGRVGDRLAARARLRGSVLMPYGQWESADLTLSTGPGVWQGLGAGRGRLRCRELTITVRGRGAAGRPRQVRVRLPGPAGRLAPALSAARAGSEAPAKSGPPVVAPAHMPAGAPAGVRRPALTVIDGGRHREAA